VATQVSLRADAARNLELILEAAEDAFAEHGNEASVADIAKRAGVGQATIFRRFATKDDLIAAVFVRKISQVAEVAESAARKRSAWDGLRAFMTYVTELQVKDQGFFQGYAERIMAENPELREQKQTVGEQIESLVERAKAEGSLREDIKVEDIHALCCAAAQAGAAGPGAWKRYLEVIQDGMRAP
jgi:AcrR family transcriptional regulator